MRQTVFAITTVAAAVYSLAASLRSNIEQDLWWQLASGRWMWTHHAVLRTEVFSYTAAGEPWTYSTAGEIIFYLLQRLGGFPLLLSLAPIACLAAVALCWGRNPSLLRASVVVVAIPLIAQRSAVRAELFTMVLLTAFLVILWNDHLEDGAHARRLWMLPALMVAWVNLHPGFILGLGVVALFTVRHPRRLILPAAATAAATFVNPFGFRIYAWVGSLAGMLPLPAPVHAALASVLGTTSATASSNFIIEFLPAPISWGTLLDAFLWRDAAWSSFWLMLLLSAVAAIVGVWRRRAWGALILALAAPLAIARLRFIGEFAVCAAVIAPDLLEGLAPMFGRMFGPWTERLAQRFEHAGWRIGWATVLAAFCLANSADRITNRYYFRQGTVSSFGLRFGQEPPDRAIQFVRDHRLPGPIFNHYNLGGYMTWAAAPGSAPGPGQPEYLDFVDGRGDPFGPDLLYQAERMAEQAPDGSDWRAAIARWNIATVVVRVTRQYGIEGVQGPAFCESSTFHLVYLDSVSAVFTRAEDPATPALDCKTVRMPPPRADASPWDRYNALAAAGRVYCSLERYQEAEQSWRAAAEVFGDGAEMRLNFGELLLRQKRMSEAEREYRAALALHPTAGTFAALGGFLSDEERIPEANQLLRAAAARESRPFGTWLRIARNELTLNRPAEALDALERAQRASPFQGDAAYLGVLDMAGLLSAKGKALLALKRPQEAVAALEKSRELSWGVGQPPDFWITLAQAYREAGRSADAARAAREIGRASSAASPFQQINQLAPIIQ